jgi:hypothetical protein
MARESVAILGPLTPAGLQGLGPPLSHALATVLSQEAPSVRGIFSPATVNLLNDRGLAAEYADLISGFVRSGILERERLQRIGSGLGSRYILVAAVGSGNCAGSIPEILVGSDGAC